MFEINALILFEGKLKSNLTNKMWRRGKKMERSTKLLMVMASRRSRDLVLSATHLRPVLQARDALKYINACNIKLDTVIQDTCQH